MSLTWTIGKSTHRLSADGQALWNSESNIGSSQSTLGHTSGQWYVEIAPVGVIDVSSVVGFATPALSADNFPGQAGNSIGWDSGGNVLPGSNSGITFGGWVAGDIISFAVDADSGKIWARKNGGAWADSGDPTTGTGHTATMSSGEIHVAAMPYASGSETARAYEILAGAANQIYLAPDGYTPWADAVAPPAVGIRAFIDAQYSITSDRLTAVDLPYGLRLGAELVMRYGDGVGRRGLVNMHYGDCPVLRRGLVLPYDDLLGHRRAVDLEYAMPPALLAAMEMRYGIADTELRAYADLQYDLLSVDLLRRQLDMPYLIQGDGLIRQVGATATIGGRPVSINHLSIEPDLEMYVIPAELHLTREADFLQVVEGEAVVLVVDGVTYNLVVDDARVSRSERGTITWIVEAMSPAVQLAAPWSRPLLRAFEATTCYSVVDELAGDLGPVDFQIDDFPVVGLYANDEDAIEVIRKVLDTVDARLQSNPDGTLRVIYEEPVDWLTRAPDFYISSERNFISQDNTTLKQPGYNRFLIGNQLTADDRLWVEQRQVSGNLVEVLGFQTPWDATKVLALDHSGGAWVPAPEYMGVVEALHPPLDEEPEQVEFVAGYAQTSRPIYNDPQLVWLREQLGAVLFSEDGRLEAEVKDGPTEGYGLAAVRYLTRYHLWRVRDDVAESVQYLLREVEA